VHIQAYLRYLACGAGLAALAAPAAAQATATGPTTDAPQSTAPSGGTASPGSTSAVPAGAAPASPGDPAEDTPPQSAKSGDIVVTGARLRETAVQATPVAVSVLPATQLNAITLQSSNLMALTSAAPNLTIYSGGAAVGTVEASIRGFNTGGSDISAEPGVAIYIDGVYQPINDGSLSDLGDLERVEVLRGPQAALLGKSASAGAILLTHTRPTGHLDAQASLEYGSYDLVSATAKIDFPIVTDILAAKVYASYRSRNGYVDDTAVPGKQLGSQENTTFRGGLLFTPATNFKFYITGDFQIDRSGQPGFVDISNSTNRECSVFHFCFPGPQAFLRTTQATFLTKPEIDQNHLSANADWTIGRIKLSSITGYNHLRQITNADYDSTPVAILEQHDQLTRYSQFSEEFRISSQATGGPSLTSIDWVIGAAYTDSGGESFSHQLTSSGLSNQSQHVHRKGESIFGSFDYNPLKNLTLSFGIRHSWDQVDHDFSLPIIGPKFNPPMLFSQSTSFQNTSMEGGFQYQFAQDKMFYFRYAEGYRSGGFAGFPSSLLADLSFQPETSRNFEGGLKTDWWDHKIRVNLTVFDTTFKNLQRKISLPVAGGGFAQIVSNAADASTRGIELETVLKFVPGLTIRGNLGYLDAKYTKYNSVTSTGTIDLSGNPIGIAPKITSSVSVDYMWDFSKEIASFKSAELNVSGSYRSKVYYVETAPNDPRYLGPAYGTINVFASVHGGVGGKVSITAYVNNLFNKNYDDFVSNSADLTPFAIPNIGRTFGVKLSLNF
jgi:iron complex outermembrane receptor protein